MTLLAIVLTVVVVAIAALHVSWGLGSHWPRASAEALAKAAIGTRGIRKMPSPASCVIVGALLGVAAAWPPFAAELLPKALPRWLTLLAGAGITAVLLGRGVAGYTRVWRRQFHEQPFATLDRRYYSPLCAALGAGYLALLVASPIP